MVRYFELLQKKFLEKINLSFIQYCRSGSFQRAGPRSDSRSSGSGTTLRLSVSQRERLVRVGRVVLCHKMADGVNHMLLELLLVCVLSVSSLYGYKEEKYGLLMPNVHPNVVSSAVHLQNQSPIVECEQSVG